MHPSLCRVLLLACWSGLLFVIFNLLSRWRYVCFKFGLTFTASLFSRVLLRAWWSGARRSGKDGQWIMKASFPSVPAPLCSGVKERRKSMHPLKVTSQNEHSSCPSHNTRPVFACYTSRGQSLQALTLSPTLTRVLCNMVMSKESM